MTCLVNFRAFIKSINLQIFFLIDRLKDDYGNESFIAKFYFLINFLNKYVSEKNVLKFVQESNFSQKYSAYFNRPKLKFFSPKRKNGNWLTVLIYYMKYYFFISTFKGIVR